MIASPIELPIYLLVLRLILWPALYVINGIAQVARVLMIAIACLIVIPLSPQLAGPLTHMAPLRKPPALTKRSRSASGR
jgi:hypothetical protein